MANIIYAVERGEYSDYRICGLFSTKEKAEEYIKLIEWAEEKTYDEPSIAEWTIDNPKISTKSIIVWMKKDGEVYTTIKSIRYDTGYFGFMLGKDGERFGWVVNTDSEERAIKVANEKRAQIIAAGIWGDVVKMDQLFRIINDDG